MINGGRKEYDIRKALTWAEIVCSNWRSTATTFCIKNEWQRGSQTYTGARARRKQPVGILVVANEGHNDAKVTVGLPNGREVRGVGARYIGGEERVFVLWLE